MQCEWIACLYIIELLCMISDMCDCSHGCLMVGCCIMLHDMVMTICYAWWLLCMLGPITWCAYAWNAYGWFWIALCGMIGLWMLGIACITCNMIAYCMLFIGYRNWFVNGMLTWPMIEWMVWHCLIMVRMHDIVLTCLMCLVWFCRMCKNIMMDIKAW